MNISTSSIKWKFFYNFSRKILKFFDRYAIIERTLHKLGGIGRHITGTRLFFGCGISKKHLGLTAGRMSAAEKGMVSK